MVNARLTRGSIWSRTPFALRMTVSSARYGVRARLRLGTRRLVLQQGAIVVLDAVVHLLEHRAEKHRLEILRACVRLLVEGRRGLGLRGLLLRQRSGG